MTIKGAGHNDLLQAGADEYFAAVSAFVAALSPLDPGFIDSMSVKELKEALAARGLDFSGCVEKSEMRALLHSALSAAGRGGAAGGAGDVEDVE